MKLLCYRWFHQCGQYKIQWMKRQTLLLPSWLTVWGSPKLEESQHQLQALVTLAHGQVNIGGDPAQGLQQGRQQKTQNVAGLHVGASPFHVHTQQDGPGHPLSLSRVGYSLRLAWSAGRKTFSQQQLGLHAQLSPVQFSLWLIRNYKSTRALNKMIWSVCPCLNWSIRMNYLAVSGQIFWK